MLRAIKIRLYPSKEQQAIMNQLLGARRYVYNQLLALKTQRYEETKESLGLNELSYHYHNVMLKDENLSWLRSQNTKVMKQGIRDLISSFEKFFKEHKGYPKFKSKKDGDSCRFPIEAISKKNTFETRHISLIKSLKNIKFRCSDLNWRRLKENKDDIKNATLTRTKSGKYVLSVLVDFQKPSSFNKFKHTGNHIGIDLGVKDFVVTSEGQVFEGHRIFKSSEEKIKKLQKQMSRKQKGSHNREKIRIRLAKTYEKSANQKENYIHYIVNELLAENDVIFMENLNVQGMLKNHNLAKAISEIGFYRFKVILKDKALLNNKLVIEIDRWYPSSKVCCVCGYKYKTLTLSEREWLCPECGTHHDRDKNAAVNILKEGERMIGCRTAEFTLVENPTMDEHSETNLKSSDSMKQETKTNFY